MSKPENKILYSLNEAARLFPGNVAISEAANSIYPNLRGVIDLEALTAWLRIPKDVRSPLPLEEGEYIIQDPTFYSPAWVDVTSLTLNLINSLYALDLQALSLWLEVEKPHAELYFLSALVWKCLSESPEV